MLWDTILGSLAAIILIVILSFMVTLLASYYQKLIDQHWRDKIRRSDLIPIIARFAAVATIILLLVLSLHIGKTG